VPERVQVRLSAGGEHERRTVDLSSPDRRLREPTARYRMHDSPGSTVRLATLADIPLLVAARRHMFEDLGEGGEWRSAGDALLAEWLNARLGKGRASGFIAEDPDGWLGALSVAHEEVPPSRRNPTGRQSYLFGLWVRASVRRRGVARALVTAAVEQSRALGEGAVTLYASDEGRGLYEQLGFEASPHMRLFLAPAQEAESAARD